MTRAVFWFHETILISPTNDLQEEAVLVVKQVYFK